nr:unnamed protein product [Callosobruchus analis]
MGQDPEETQASHYIGKSSKEDATVCDQSIQKRVNSQMSLCQEERYCAQLLLRKNASLMWLCNGCLANVRKLLACSDTTINHSEEGSRLQHCKLHKKRLNASPGKKNLMQKLLYDQEYTIRLQKQNIQSLGIKDGTGGNVLINKPKPTYREVAATKKNQIIIKPADNSSNIDLQSEVRKYLNPIELKININSVKSTASGSLAISCDSERCVETIKNSLHEKTSSLKVQLPSELLDRNDLQHNAGGFLRIVKKLNSRFEKDRSDVIVEVTSEMRNILLDRKSLYIGLQKCSVIVIRCLKCTRFGHTKKFCKSESIICFKCGEKHDPKTVA